MQIPAVPARNPALVVTVFLVGALLGVVTSGGLLEERLSLGNPTIGVVVNGVVTFASILLLAFVERRMPRTPRVLVLQAFGAVCGIALVHLAVRHGIIAAPSWLSERPAQFVNDAVAVFSMLGLVWACALGLDLRFLLGALLLVTAYRFTALHWHVDEAPHGFVVKVQDLVIAQFVAAAIALPVYRGISRHAD